MGQDKKMVKKDGATLYVCSSRTLQEPVKGSRTQNKPSRSGGITFNAFDDGKSNQR